MLNRYIHNTFITETYIVFRHSYSKSWWSWTEIVEQSVYEVRLWDENIQNGSNWPVAPTLCTSARDILNTFLPSSSGKGQYKSRFYILFLYLYLFPEFNYVVYFLFWHNIFPFPWTHIISWYSLKHTSNLTNI